MNLRINELTNLGKFKRKFFLFLLLLIPIFLNSYIPASAQSVSLSISPPLLEAMIKPGKSIVQPYEIVNESGTDLYLRPIIVPFEPSDLNGNILLDPKFLNSYIPKFFSLANNNFQLNQTFRLSAGEKGQLLLRITIPDDEAETDHYFTFIIEQSPEGEFLGRQNGGSNLIKIGSNILLTISSTGLPKKQAVVAKFAALPKIADLFFDKIKFSLLVQNTGRTFLKPVGQIDIYNRLTKKKVETLALQPDNVLANSARLINCLTDKPITEQPTTDNRPPNNCSFSTFIPGAYRAVISFSPNGNDSKETASATFFFLPLRSALAIIVISLLIWKIWHYSHRGKQKNR